MMSQEKVVSPEEILVVSLEELPKNLDWGDWCELSRSAGH
jgi:hypothetical protein